MRWVIIAAALCMMMGEIVAVIRNNASPLEQAGGLVAICAGIGAVFLLSRAQDIADSERRLGELDDLVAPDRAAELIRSLQRKDRFDQLTLIIISAAGSALQAFAGELLWLSRWALGLPS